MSQGPIEVGEAVLTPGGNLAATHVIHAAVMGPDLKTDPETIARDHPLGARSWPTSTASRRSPCRPSGPAPVRWPSRRPPRP